MQNYCTPIASDSAAAPRLHRSPSMLLPDCIVTAVKFPVSVRFSCCSPLACIRFGCSSPKFNSCPIACASAAAPQLRPLQLLFPEVQQLPDCVHFGCCFPIASASTAAPRLHPLNACSLTCSGRFQPMPNVLEHSLWSSRFSKLKYEGRARVTSPAPRTSHFRHTHTQTHIIY